MGSLNSFVAFNGKFVLSMIASSLYNYDDVFNIYTSQDGTTWDIGYTSESQFVTGISYSEALDELVGLCYDFEAGEAGICHGASVETLTSNYIDASTLQLEYNSGVAFANGKWVISNSYRRFIEFGAVWTKPENGGAWNKTYGTNFEIGNVVVVDNKFFVGTAEGILISTDAEDWEELSFNDGYLELIEVNGNLYAWADTDTSISYFDMVQKEFDLLTAPLTSIAYDSSNNLWVGSGFNEQQQQTFYYSEDGITFKEGDAVTTDSVQFLQMGVIDEQYVAVGGAYEGGYGIVGNTNVIYASSGL